MIQAENAKKVSAKANLKGDISIFFDPFDKGPLKYIRDNDYTVPRFDLDKVEILIDNAKLLDTDSKKYYASKIILDTRKEYDKPDNMFLASPKLFFNFALKNLCEKYLSEFPHVSDDLKLFNFDKIDIIIIPKLVWINLFDTLEKTLEYINGLKISDGYFVENRNNDLINYCQDFDSVEAIYYDIIKKIYPIFE